MPKIYDFQTQLERGQFFEKVVDDYFRSMLDMTPEVVPRELERAGIDRIVKTRSGTVFVVEIKADERGQQTGNAFIETVSIERNGVIEKLGWIHTSQAQILAYYLPLLGEIIFIDMPAFKRRFFRQYQDSYPSRAIKNKTYTGHGTLLPLTAMRDDAFHIASVEPVAFK